MKKNNSLLTLMCLACSAMFVTSCGESKIAVDSTNGSDECLRDANVVYNYSK